MASWTDTATLSGGPITSGKLDLGLDSAAVGLGTGYDASTVITASDLAPGESRAYAVSVRNLGTTPLTYTATGAASGDLATLSTVPAASRLQWTFVPNGTASNTGTAAAGTRAGSCGGSASTFSGALGATAVPVVPTSSQPTIATGGAQSLCLLVSLPTSAPNDLQQKSATATLVFSAKQVGAP
jgi:hypothetical protein